MNDKDKIKEIERIMRRFNDKIDDLRLERDKKIQKILDEYHKNKIRKTIN